MQLKTSTDYAMRIVLYLSAKQDFVTSKDISESLHIPQSYVFKIIRQLQDIGLIYSVPGIQGGFYISKMPEEITMYEIIDRMEKTIKINQCLDCKAYCSSGAIKFCPVREIYSEIQNKLESYLKSVTMKDILNKFYGKEKVYE